MIVSERSCPLELSMTVRMWRTSVRDGGQSRFERTQNGDEWKKLTNSTLESKLVTLTRNAVHNLVAESLALVVRDAEDRLFEELSSPPKSRSAKRVKEAESDPGADVRKRGIHEYWYPSARG
jgi:hypothetical protein